MMLLTVICALLPTLLSILSTTNGIEFIPKESALSRQSNLGSSSLLYGMLRKVNGSNMNNACYEQLQTIYSGINRKEVWAMKVLDSSARLASGFVFANNFWLGSMRECEALNDFKVTISSRYERNMKPNLIDGTAPFKMEYMVVHAKHDSPWQIQIELTYTQKILHVGLCVPQSCQLNEIHNIAQYYFDVESEFTSEYEFQPKILQVKTLKVEINFFKKTSVQLTGAFLLATLLLTVAGSILQIQSENTNCVDVDNNNNSSNGANKSTEKQRISLTASLLKCFSINDNLKYILSVDSPSDSIPTINGLKSIGCYLILFSHVISFGYVNTRDGVAGFAHLEKPTFQWCSTVILVVEIYFTFSGLLLSYAFLRNQRNIFTIQQNTLWKNIKYFLLQVLHRYLRLAPFYLFVVGLTEISGTYLHETSPFWIVDRIDLTCRAHWWRNLFFIQNLFPLNEYCAMWTWYLACEFQYFVFFTFLLFLYAKYPNVTKKIFVSLFVAFTALAYMVTYTAKLQFSFDIVLDLLQETYLSPWMRILPYFVGVGTGWFMLNGKNAFSKTSSSYLCMAAVSFILSCHLFPMNRALSYEISVPTMILSRILYSLSAAWIIVASTTGNRTLIWKFMNHKVFVHFNKLTYGMYLLHPLVITFLFGIQEQASHFDSITLFLNSIGIALIVYLSAFACSLLFEVPYARLFALLVKNHKKKTL